jgi:putative nucleotidyltransferase with HDIG domain
MTTPPPIAAAADDAYAVQDALRLAHLFRVLRRQGRIHPLQHLLQRYRSATPRDPAQALGVAPQDSTAGAVATAAAAYAAPEASSLIDRAQLSQHVRELPALPQAAMEALAMLRSEDASAERCAELIARDQALVARTLRLANSAFYGVPGRVGSMRDAVHLLGRRTLGSLLTVATLAPQFQAQGCALFSFVGFWRHAIATALAARGLAGALGHDEEQAFTVGLLHDIGRLALAAYFPAQTTLAIQRARALDAGLPAIEREVLGIDHVELGAQVAAQWHFPAEVVSAIAGHHAPQAVAAGGASLTDIVHLADAMAHALDLAGDPHEVVPAIDAASWDRLALTPQTALKVLGETELGVAGLSEAMGLDQRAGAKGNQA